MSELKFDNATRQAVVQLVSYHDIPIEPDSANIKVWLNKLGKEQFKRLLEVKSVNIKDFRDATQLEELEFIRNYMIIF